MKEYQITVPYTGKYTCQVVAESPEEAIEKAIDGDFVPHTEDDHAELVKVNWKRARAKEF